MLTLVQRNQVSPDIEFLLKSEMLKSSNTVHYRDVTTGATAVAPKFSDTLTLSQPGGQILPTIAEVEPKFSP